MLRDVMFGNRRHFNEMLASSEEGIASNILADRLQRLVRSGLLTRDEAGRGRKATYSLTDAAIELVPVFAELGAWGVRHRPTSPELADRAQRLAEGGPELWAKFMAELRKSHLTDRRPEERPNGADHGPTHRAGRSGSTQSSRTGVAGSPNA